MNTAGDVDKDQIKINDIGHKMAWITERLREIYRQEVMKEPFNLRYIWNIRYENRN